MDHEVAFGNVHVFVASFPTSGDAQTYTQELWESEPDSSVSDEEYADWEDRNPTWKMRDELGITFLDSDFIEIVWGSAGSQDRADWTYLASQIDSEGADACKAMAPIGSNTLILILEGATGRFPFQFRSTSTLFHCGKFAWKAASHRQ